MLVEALNHGLDSGPLQVFRMNSCKHIATVAQSYALTCLGGSDGAASYNSGPRHGTIRHRLKRGCNNGNTPNEPLFYGVP